ncbi:hypothetical protein D3C81_1366410 [compost metagenome]
MQRFDLAVADAQRAVGIRIHRAALRRAPIKQRLHVRRTQAQLLAFAFLAQALGVELCNHQCRGRRCQRITFNGTALACAFKARQTLCFIAQLRLCVQRIQARGQLCRRTAEQGVVMRVALCIGQLLITGEQRGENRLLHGGIVATLYLLEHAFDQRLVALLVAGFALGVGLERFHAQPFQQQRRTHQLGLAGHQRHQEFAVAHFTISGQRGEQGIDVGLVLAVGGSQHGLFVLRTLGLGIAAQ